MAKWSSKDGARDNTLVSASNAKDVWRIPKSWECSEMADLSQFLVLSGLSHISGGDCLPDRSSNPLFRFHLVCKYLFAVCLPLAACLLFCPLFCPLSPSMQHSLVCHEQIEGEC